MSWAKLNQERADGTKPKAAFPKKPEADTGMGAAIARRVAKAGG